MWNSWDWDHGSFVFSIETTIYEVSSGHRLIWWGDATSICNEPNASQNLMRKSFTFACAQLRGNKSKLGLEEALVIKLVKL